MNGLFDRCQLSFYFAFAHAQSTQQPFVFIMGYPACVDLCRQTLRHGYEGHGR